MIKYYKQRPKEGERDDYFEVDFTYERKSNHYLSENDRLFTGSRIKVRKNLIVMGSNASGKTTFGKLLCMIFNFIYGKDLGDGSFSIPSARYDKFIKKNGGLFLDSFSNSVKLNQVHDISFVIYDLTILPSDVKREVICSAMLQRRLTA